MSAWKDRLENFLRRVLPKDLAKTLPRNLEPMAMAEWASHALQRQSAAFYGKVLTVVLSSYFLADLSALVVEKYIPEPPRSNVVRQNTGNRRPPNAEDYNVIAARNLFSSEGRIPGEDIPGGASGVPMDLGGAPVKSTLPFTLIGTMIFHDELKSIATIEDKSGSPAAVYPVRVQDEIPTKARIVTIEPRRVIFVNTSSGRREFIELPEEAASSNPRVALRSTVGGGGKGGPGIERVSPTQFNIARTEVDKALSDFNKILTEARAVPNFENGLPAGYKLFQIVPGSIYDKLGLQNGDTICGLDGQPINDPGKAFEMLGALKTSSHLELCVKRDGKTSNYAYDIR